MTSNQKTKTRTSGTKSNADDGKPTTKRQQRKYPVKFDSGGFNLMTGIGFAMTAVGALIVWASQTAPEGKPVSATNYSVSRKLAEALPESTSQWIATILGSLFVLFGIFCIIMAIKMVVQYFVAKAKE
ncbi:MAG: hypothetical protein A2W90_15615 [Bacteroidetes bacterium GWF2_42_66]|nr:MAG: hypothetical protein A2W92_08145 [Bacteroidetes bacterium GWA2_42_15]OFY02687.1 MAG: hypothetical protein A2W89_04200 [Bacteroidetes bacterium GWE2_42_39]OFY43886.1 MAG: hypothetical protein A2W90_15615 [Bacteroidetes bacterium GWF2_42_66]HBL77255.1 hypothetical protein [Prolixibacteraceae bacterium]HCR90631.1 hypothetical protein [Prolixibacteraceae bacterium]